MTGYQQDRPADGAPASQEPRRNHNPRPRLPRATKEPTMPDVHAAAERIGKHPDLRTRLEAVFTESQTHLDRDLTHAETLGSAKAAVDHIRKGMAAWSAQREHVITKVAG